MKGYLKNVNGDEAEADVDQTMLHMYVSLFTLA